MSWLAWLDGEPATTQAEADPGPRGYGPFICKEAEAQRNVPEQDAKKPEPDTWAAVREAEREAGG